MKKKQQLSARKAKARALKNLKGHITRILPHVTNGQQRHELRLVCKDIDNSMAGKGRFFHARV